MHILETFVCDAFFELRLLERYYPLLPVDRRTGAQGGLASALGAAGMRNKGSPACHHAFLGGKLFLLVEYSAAVVVTHSHLRHGEKKHAGMIKTTLDRVCLFTDTLLIRWRSHQQDETFLFSTIISLCCLIKILVTWLISLSNFSNSFTLFGRFHKKLIQLLNATLSPTLDPLCNFGKGFYASPRKGRGRTGAFLAQLAAIGDCGMV